MTTAPSNDCLAPEDIDAFLRGELTSSPRAALERHVGTCAACRELMAVLTRLDSRPSRSPPDESPPTVSGGPEVPLGNGTRIGRYVVLERLGEGGMGVVYAAQDPELARKVAIKLLRGDFGPAEQRPLRERLRHEAQAMAQMAHPNVVTVYDVGTWSDRIFVAMELVEGQTLSQWLAAPHPWRQILDRFLAAGEGLAAAHAAGLVHHDFKPANVLLGADGRVRVGDFGLAALAVESVPPAPLERDELAAAVLRGAVRSVAGTPYYMAPEELLGTPAGARGDQFSFCVALHAALTGEHPFAGDSVEENLQALAAGRRRPSRDVPRRLRRPLSRGLSIDPADRYPSMRELLDALAGRAPPRWVLAAALAAGAAALALAAVAALRGPPAGTGRPAARIQALSRYEADVFGDAAESLRTYDRERIAMQTGACESPAAGCAVRSANLLRDAGFDGAGAAWRPPGTSPATRLDWRGGHLTLTGDRDASVAQELPWIIPPGRSFRLSARVRAHAGQPARGQLVLWGIGQRGPSSATTRFAAGPDWAPVSVTFTPKSHYHRFRAEIHLDAPGSIDLDSAELVDTGLIDTSFEDASILHRSAAWRALNLASDVYLASEVTDAFDGERVLRFAVEKPDASVAQDTTQSPLAGTTYTFAARLRAGPGASHVEGNLVLWALGEEQRLAITGFDVGTAWTTVEASLDIDRVGYAGLRAEIYLSTVAAVLEVDTAELTPAGLVDPSFETGSSAWRPTGAPGAIEVRRMSDGSRRGPTGLFEPGSGRPLAKNGDHWLRVSAARPVGAIAQDLAPPPRGANYTFSVWVRAEPGASGAAGSLTIDALGGAPESGQTAFQAGADWTLATTTLEVRADGHTGLRVAIAPAAGAALDIDSARLTGPSTVPASITQE